MMKALHPQTKTYQKGNLDKFWLRLFEKLYLLARAQLIVCPDSTFHSFESLLSPYYQPLKRMYKLLSHGIGFMDSDTIKRFQLMASAENWINGHPEKELDLDINNVIRGEINDWQGRFTISVNLNFDVYFIEQLRPDPEKNP
jgi:hypothetical protein